MASPLKKFSVPFNVAATAAADAFCIEASATKRARVTRVVLTNYGFATTATVNVVAQLLRTTAAGSGGVVTPKPEDPVDPYGAASVYGGIVRSGVGVGGAAGDILKEMMFNVPATPAMPLSPPVVFNFGGGGPSYSEPSPTTGSGVASGIALRFTVGAGASGFRGWVEFIEE